MSTANPADSGQNLEMTLDDEADNSGTSRDALRTRVEYELTSVWGSSLVHHRQRWEERAIPGRELSCDPLPASFGQRLPALVTGDTDLLIQGKIDIDSEEGASISSKFADVNISEILRCEQWYAIANCCKTVTRNSCRNSTVCMSLHCWFTAADQW